MSTSGDDALEITTPAGATLDLAPLVAAAQGIRRNALLDAEHEIETGISQQGLAHVLMGMRIAVLHLAGDDAARRFSDAVANHEKS